MPKFTLKQLFASITLIVIGIVGLLSANKIVSPIAWLSWFGGGACVGAGIYVLSGRVVRGIVMGLIVTFIASLVIASFGF